MRVPGQPVRVLSGMRPTGKLHLGHYHGVIKPWVEMQHEHQCFYFVADWHALTTEFEIVNEKTMRNNVWDMIIDWLACGVDPGNSNDFHSVPGSRTCGALLVAVNDQPPWLA